MVNTEKAVKRNRTRLIKSQNPQQIDYKRMRKAREAKTKYWALKKKAHGSKFVAVVDDKKKPKKEKKPELEVVEDEPELEVVDEELDEIFSLDDEELEDDEDIADDAEEEDSE